MGKKVSKHIRASAFKADSRTKRYQAHSRSWNMNQQSQNPVHVFYDLYELIQGIITVGKAQYS